MLLFLLLFKNHRLMKPSDSFRMHRAVIRRLVESHHARNARGFGSVVRGDDTDGRSPRRSSTGRDLVRFGHIAGRPGRSLGHTSRSLDSG